MRYLHKYLSKTDSDQFSLSQPPRRFCFTSTFPNLYLFSSMHECRIEQPGTKPKIASYTHQGLHSKLKLKLQSI